MRWSLLAALVLSACAAHEPTPQIHVPDETQPAQVEPDAREVPEAAPQADVAPSVQIEGEPEPPARSRAASSTTRSSSTRAASM